MHWHRAPLANIHILSLSLSRSRKRARRIKRLERLNHHHRVRDRGPSQSGERKERERKKKKREKDERLGCRGLISSIVARGIPHPTASFGQIENRKSVEAWRLRFWATQDPFNELVIAFWTGHPRRGRGTAIFCFCCPRPPLLPQRISERLGGCDQLRPPLGAASKSRVGRKSASGSAVDDDYYIYIYVCESPVGSSV